METFSLTNATHKQPLAPPTPPTPAPPSPPHIPQPAPKPTPPGYTWQCHPKAQADDTKLKMADYDFVRGFKTIVDCQEACNAVKDCTVVNLHEVDMHCHVLSGAAVTQKQFEAALLTSSTYASYETCVLLKTL